MNTTDPTFLAGIALALFGIAGGVNQVMSIIDRVKGKPPAEQLQTHAELLAKRVDAVEEDVHVVAEDVKELRESIVRNGDIRRQAIEAKVEAARCEAREEFKEIRAEIKLLSNELSSARTIAENTHNSLVLLAEKTDRLRFHQS